MGPMFLKKPCTVDGRITDSNAESCWAANKEGGVAKTRTTWERAHLLPFVDGSAGNAFHHCHQDAPSFLPLGQSGCGADEQRQLSRTRTRKHEPNEPFFEVAILLIAPITMQAS
jgi:hypothetical protein